MKVSARREFREQNRLRISFERNLRRQLERIFARIGDDVAKQLEQSQPVSSALRRIPNDIAKVLNGHYNAVVREFSERAEKLIDQKFDTFEQILQGYLRQQGGQHITQISNTTRSLIMRTIAKAQAEDLGVSQTAKRIREAMKGGFSKYRASTIARTETHSASTFANNQIALSSNIPTLKKQWVSAQDSRTRQHHLLANGQTVGMKEPFIIPYNGIDYKMQFAGDPMGGAVNTINCRCVVIYVKDQDEVIDDTPIPVSAVPKPKGGFGFVVQPKEKTIVLSPTQAKKKVEDSLKSGALDDVYDQKSSVYRSREPSDFGKLSSAFDDETNEFLSSAIDDCNTICSIFAVPKLRGFKPVDRGSSIANMGDGIMALNRRDFKAGRYSKNKDNKPVLNLKLSDKDWEDAHLRAKEKRIKGKDAQEYFAQQDDTLGRRPWVLDDYFDNDYDRMRSTIFHELGHHIHQMTGWTASNPKLRSMVRQMRGGTSTTEQYMKRKFKGLFKRKAPTRYGDTNVVEWFAENFSAWAMGRKDLLSPDFEIYIKELIDEAK